MVKAFLISALRSGEGKTLITLGLIRLLKRSGLKVQPFKVGPDYIDPMWHRIAGGVPSYNLDLFAMGKERLKKLFFTKSSGKDISVIEGVMGLFDGKYSSFTVAKLLRVPVILVVDTYGLAETIRALLKGPIERLQRSALPFGLILNRISSERHLLRIEKALKGYPILGYLRRDEKLHLGSRHLGLLLPEDCSEVERFLDYLAESLERNLNMELFETFRIQTNSEIEKPSFLPKIPYKTIAIAYDRAFNFYYQHLLDELSGQCEVILFSPLEDRFLPSGAQALYLGGGYPELFAERLEKNHNMLKELKDWIQAKMPLYAECGGFIYLCKALYWEERHYQLAGIFPFTVTKGSLKLGYRLVRPLSALPLFECELSFRGHEFHYTELVNGDMKLLQCYRVRDPQGRRYREGYLINRCLASYIHLIAFENGRD